MCENVQKMFLYISNLSCLIIPNFYQFNNCHNIDIVDSTKKNIPEVSVIYI